MNTLSLSKRHPHLILAAIMAFPVIAKAAPLDFAPADMLLAVLADGVTKNILVNLAQGHGQGAPYGFNALFTAADT